MINQLSSPGSSSFVSALLFSMFVMLGTVRAQDGPISDAEMRRRLGLTPTLDESGEGNRAGATNVRAMARERIRSDAISNIDVILQALTDWDGVESELANRIDEVMPEIEEAIETSDELPPEIIQLAMAELNQAKQDFAAKRLAFEDALEALNADPLSSDSRKDVSDARRAMETAEIRIDGRERALRNAQAEWERLDNAVTQAQTNHDEAALIVTELIEQLRTAQTQTERDRLNAQIPTAQARLRQMTTSLQSANDNLNNATDKAISDLESLQTELLDEETAPIPPESP